MTNGEKFKQIFFTTQVDECDLNVYAWLPIHDTIEIPLEWWNAEYKEPTTKNNLGVDFDCISRFSAEQVVRNHYCDIPSKVYSKLMVELDSLPPLTPELRWIPTSERSPEEDGEYYATVYDTDENYKYMDIAELENGIWQYKDYVKVLAWMPLPKAYREVEG